GPRPAARPARAQRDSQDPRAPRRDRPARGRRSDLRRRGRPRPRAPVPPRGAPCLRASGHGRAGRRFLTAPARARRRARGGTQLTFPRSCPYSPAAKPWRVCLSLREVRLEPRRRTNDKRIRKEFFMAVSTEPVSTGAVSMRDLLEAGVHFGHQTRRWNPKMRRFIFAERGGIYIIDLTQTAERLEEAQQFLRNVAERGGTVLFVGTKKQAQDAVESEAERIDMPYVNHRWLGGL